MAGRQHDGVGNGKERCAFRHPPVVARVAIHLFRIARAAQGENVPVGFAVDRLVLTEEIAERVRRPAPMTTAITPTQGYKEPRNANNASWSD